MSMEQGHGPHDDGQGMGLVRSVIVGRNPNLLLVSSGLETTTERKNPADDDGINHTCLALSASSSIASPGSSTSPVEEGVANDRAKLKFTGASNKECWNCRWEVGYEITRC